MRTAYVALILCGRVALALCFTTPTLAAPITATFDLVASGFYRNPPVDPVRLNFTVRFDPTHAVLPTGFGLQINSINISFGGPLPIQFAFDGVGTLTVGTSLSDGGFRLSSGKYGFGTIIKNAFDTPQVSLFGYTQGTPVIYYTQHITGTEVEEISGTTVEKEIEAVAVPEPGTIFLLAFGLIGLAATMRRIDLN